jgi:hypothetical protein
MESDERRRRGGAPQEASGVTRIDTRAVPTLYVLLMAAWVYGFAAIDRELPPLLVFALLLAGGAVQVGAGFLIGRWAALGLGCVPVLLAAAASGAGSPLFAALVVLMAFPGTPLIGVGVWVRRWRDETRDDSPDSWLYGERAG